MSPIGRIAVWFVVLFVILFLEGSIGKAYREFTMPLALLFVVWGIVGFFWGVRGMFRYFRG